jgi:hypothetical protein
LHDHSFSNIIFDVAFDLHHAHLKSYANPGASAWLFVRLVIPPLCLPFDIFSFALRTRLGFPHPLAFKVTHCICGQPLDSVGTHLFHCSHSGEWTCIPWCDLKCLHLHCKRCKVSCFMWVDPCPSTPFPFSLLVCELTFGRHRF